MVYLCAEQALEPLVSWDGLGDLERGRRAAAGGGCVLEPGVCPRSSRDTVRPDAAWKFAACIPG